MGIFDAFASSYIREDTHWGCDLDVLRAAIREVQGHQAKYLDLGCGPGFHVIEIASTYPEIEVLGVDSSKLMLKKASERAHLLSLNNIRLVNANITRFTTEEQYDVVSCLNNTLNNLYEISLSPAKLRRDTLQRIHEMLRLGGNIVLSVYNREKLRIENYTHALAILPESDVKHGELFLEHCDENGSREQCYSHWSTSEELVDLLKACSFEVDLLERRMERIVVKARAT